MVQELIEQLDMARKYAVQEGDVGAVFRIDRMRDYLVEVINQRNTVKFWGS